MRNQSEDKIMLTFIRHGETQANKERRYLGKTDEPLTESGRNTLLAYRENCVYPPVKYLFTSPMIRCVETAHILYPELQPMIIPEWTELDFGRFEYKNYEELKDDETYQEWVDSGGALGFPEGESLSHFSSRCEKGFFRMCDALRGMLEKDADGTGILVGRKLDERILAGRDLEEQTSVGLIVHGGVIMALLSAHNGNDYFTYQVSNGKGYVCSMAGDDYRNIPWQDGALLSPESVKIRIIREL
ncbi:MAG: histidine phosphatase family protein [Blautia sp.]|nr:histidine phosphatase family protein [Lachnoclostridium sp.]MCM1210773.1 histidine phosphatase family protein [Blautia sp.]